jgi:hypothetical protein
VYAEEGGKTFGAVRCLVPQTNALVVYIENAGDFEVPAEAVRRVHDGKVIAGIAEIRVLLGHRRTMALFVQCNWLRVLGNTETP